MKAPRGFTIIELMIVVAIIGILSVLSITGYKKVLSKSRLAEGHNVVSGVKIAQDQYFAETGRYADIGWNNICPQNSPKATIPSNAVTGWNPACRGGAGADLAGNLPWSMLAYSPDGAIRFGVMTTAVRATIATVPPVPSSDGNVDALVAGVPTRAPMTLPSAPPKPWYAVAAIADLDGDVSDATRYTTIYTTSLNTQIWVDREGE